MEQRAATLWYHDHRHGATGLAVWRGLAGFHVIHDDEEDALPLPSGDRDIPLMIADRSFAQG
jgi:FtsP/CotA-like multicopper oxidase with cupredoxin domain